MAFFSFSLMGCYTQLAFVDDSGNSPTVYSSPTIIEPIIGEVLYPVPSPIPPSPPPTAPIYMPIANPQPVNSNPTYTTRDSGYQRGGSSSDNQETNSRSEIRSTQTGREGR